jgi:hypothetical protein
MRDASLPVALIVVGLGWLLWEFRLFPDLDWIIALGFVIGGVLVLVIDGINKNSIVLGPFLVGIGVAWFVHDRYFMPWRVMIPGLLVLLGLLMLVARSTRIPERSLRHLDTPQK